MKPFESLTKLFGLPLNNEVDPTGISAVFFIIFFALCLTDASYGILLLVFMYVLVRALKMPKKSQGLYKVLMYSGIVTFFIGAIFGGWFGLTADQVPEFLTYQAADGSRMFLFQYINPVTNPLAVLILSLVLGFIQVWFGTLVNYVWTLKSGLTKEAWLDRFPWLFILTAIAFFISVKAGVLPEILSTFAVVWVLVAALGIVLTQGRDKKNPIVKILSGILSLYDLVGYLSSILSYSRLLALGLATSIIAMAVNVIAELLIGIPYVGWILAAIVFIFGHIFSLVINALGSFIHSARLQFVEFFGTFLQGGGSEFKPLRRETKYVTLQEKSNS